MEEVSHLIIKVSSEEVNAATKAMNTMSKATSGLTSLIGGLITAAAALAIFKQAASTIADFTKQMSAVQAVTRASVDEMQHLSLVAREFGAATKFSGAEAAEGMKFLGQAGFTTQQIIATMPGMLDLATAGELGLADAADITTAALAGFRLQASESSKVADILAVAAGESNTSVAQMGDAMKYVAPIAAGMNKSIEEVSAAIGVLSNAGLQGSTAGTGLRQVLSSLASPTKEAADVLNAYGVKIDEVNPEIHSLAEVIERLGKAGLSASDALVIAGDRGGNALVALTAQEASFKKLNASMNNVTGRAHEMAQVMGDNLSGDFQKLKSAVSEIYLALGEAGLTDVLRTVTKATTDFARAFADIINSGQAKAWADLLISKFTLVSDGFFNLSQNITGLWTLTMDYLTGDAKGTVDTIIDIFTLLPENVRATAQGIGASFALAWEAVYATAKHTVDEVVALFTYLVDTATNLGKEIWDQLSNIGKSGKFDYTKAQADAFDKLAVSATNSWGQITTSIGNATEAWQQEITAIMNEWDANVAASDDKLRRINALADAYKKLKATRDASDKPTGGTVGNAPAAAGPSHFNTQEYEQLRKQLQGEEQTVQESYDKRLDLIRRNTKEGSDLRRDLEKSLGERYLVELDQAQQAIADRLDASYEAQMHRLQDQLSSRLITEAEFQDASKKAWQEYTTNLGNITTRGTQFVAVKQMEMYSQVLELAGGITQQIQGLAKENTGAAKALFAINKAIAVAEIIVNTQLGAAKAIGQLGPFGIPMAAFITATGYASAAITAATAIAGFEHGGTIGAGKIGLVGETGQPELVRGPAVVTSARATADLMSGSKGGSTTVNIINQAQGITVEQGQERQTDNGKVIDLIVKQTISKLTNSVNSGGNGFTKAFEGRYGLKRGASSAA